MTKWTWAPTGENVKRWVIPPPRDSVSRSETEGIYLPSQEALNSADGSSYQDEQDESWACGVRSISVCDGGEAGGAFDAVSVVMIFTAKGMLG